MNLSIKGNPQQARNAATLGFFIGLAAVSLFGLTATMLQEVLNVGPALMGLLIAAPMLSGALLRIPFAAWVDINGGRKPFLILLSLSIVGMGGIWCLISQLYPQGLNAQHYPLLVFLALLSGCGIATFSVGASQVAYWFPQQTQGKALGLYAGIANLAPGIFALILPFALEHLGLAGSYFAWFIFLSAGTCVYFLIGCNAPYFQYRKQGMGVAEAKQRAQENGQAIFPKGNLMESLKISAGHWENWVMVGLYFTSFGGFIALTAWFPTYWKSAFFLNNVMAGLLTAMYSIAASLFRVAGGVISDRLGGAIILLFACIFILIGALLMTQVILLPWAIAASLVLALGMGLTNAAVFKLLPQVIPDAIGGAAGWVGGLGTLGGFVIPPLMGMVVATNGHAGYAQGFYIFVALGVSAIVLACVLVRQGRFKNA